MPQQKAQSHHRSNQQIAAPRLKREQADPARQVCNPVNIFARDLFEGKMISGCSQQAAADRADQVLRPIDRGKPA